ncbi:class I SAM-dependent DNA methyltransferase [Maricaulis sp.]|uniref:class I SAM-dependent DNA methyltransferase n=1 Tax=Maricaulis sp. TaxID=1486257 RepID=UPI002B27BB20|nr:DNA methyltransferase [Maricaulis sp.]
MSEEVERLKKFVAYRATLSGDEKGEAQVFCDRLFQAFGHDGYKEAGAGLEYRIKKADAKGTAFADLVWKPRVLIEMKKSGEKLSRHYDQAFEYWINAVPDRPRYVVLCNFDEFYIYDFDRQLNDPVDIVSIDELPKRYTALNFLFRHDPRPIFENDREAVSRSAADKMAALFRSVTERNLNPVGRDAAQRFVLQLMVAMFAEDIDLLPSGTVVNIVYDCLNNGQSSFDLFGGLFRQMDTEEPAKGGRFKGVRYFNGGLFNKVEPIELSSDELKMIGGNEGAATEDWSKINPVIFGTLFQQSMDKSARHAFGAHFTSESDIHRIVRPTIVEPWIDRIDSTKRLQDLINLRRELMEYRVLDPACGSGNFLYTAYRELARLDLRILRRMEDRFSAKNVAKQSITASIVSPNQFYGLDVDSFAVELSKVTLMLAKKLALDEALDQLGRDEMELGFNEGLPLDNLDENISQDDALFCEWPEVDAIIGNPPFQSKNKIQDELGVEYVHRLRAAHPDVPGLADYCVYWFRLAHDHLDKGGRAGLVGTNSIRQNYSREGGLDYITSEGGMITEAVSSMPWSGDAAVHVSIVNWIKGKSDVPKRLYLQQGSDPLGGWRYEDRASISSSLSFGVDVTKAKTLRTNSAGFGCAQGQTHGHKAFLLNRDDAEAQIKGNPALKDVLFPYLIANDLVGSPDSLPSRYVIDFGERDQLEAREFEPLFSMLQQTVLPKREQAALKEQEKNEALKAIDPTARLNRHHEGFLRRWWTLSYRRSDLMRAITNVKRYIVCGRVTKRPIFEFLSPTIHPGDALTVFVLEDDYSFGILQSDVHWNWFVERCSTLREDFRYTSNSVFDSFPWPQKPTLKDALAVAKAARELRNLRRSLCEKHGFTLRELYRSAELPGDHPVDEAKAKLEAAVRACYGMTPKVDALRFLFELNQQLNELEARGSEIFGPGLPERFSKNPEFYSDDCLALG